MGAIFGPASSIALESLPAEARGLFSGVSVANYEIVLTRPPQVYSNKDMRSDISSLLLSISDLCQDCLTTLDTAVCST